MLFRSIVANAKALAAALLERGYELVSGGTDNHLLLVDLTSKQVTGKVAAKALDAAGIELNFNTVPFDPRRPFDPSGLRIGSAAITTRGLTTEHMPAVAGWIERAVTAASRGPLDEADVAGELGKVAGEVRDLLKAFPMPGYATETASR